MTTYSSPPVAPPPVPPERPAMGAAPTATALITAMCAAQTLSMLGGFTFPALLPQFQKIWDLSNTQAGWINGIYFAGYSIAVPVLASLTDRLDARRIYFVSAVVGGLSALGFAFLASGFFTALFFRSMSGFGLAGTFIPGLKALIDRLDESSQARAISFYVATFSLGMSLSFYFSGKSFAWFGWQWTFTLTAVGSLGSLCLAAAVLKPRPHAVPQQHARLLDFRPIWRNRRTMCYITAYVSHMWELFAARSWMVAFLAFNLSLQRAEVGWWRPPTVMAVAGMVGMLGNVAGAELCLHFRRTRVITVIMWGSALVAFFIGFGAHLSYPVVALICITYSMFLQGDSAALYAGIMEYSNPERRGLTMAFQSLVGFAGAFVGPVVVGWVIDLTGGGRTVWSWVAAFWTMGAAVLIGPLFLVMLSRSAQEKESLLEDDNPQLTGTAINNSRGDL